MHAASTSARRARTHHRQNLHTLTYVIVDESNGGIIRNLNHQGLAIQAVSTVRLRQRVRVRFELRRPRVKVDSMGEVVWADLTGQCGIRFLDLPAENVRQINEWILGDLLDSIPSRTQFIFGPSSGVQAATAGDEDMRDAADGLLLSMGARKVIPLRPQEARCEPYSLRGFDPELPAAPQFRLDWLTRPLSAKQIAWALNSLIVFAALLLYVVVILAAIQDFPRWPLDLEAGFGAVLFVSAFYWFFSWVLGGSVGARLARLAEREGEDDAKDSARFR